MAKTKAKSKTEKKYTAADIIDLYDNKRASTAFAALIEQMESDFNLFALEPYQAEEGHQAYTSSKPKNDFNKVFSAINRASLTYQVVTAEDAPETERDEANDTESFLTGMISEADADLNAVGEPVIRDGMAWFGCGRGVSALKCLIYTDENKKTQRDIRYLDPMHMAWERGSQGMVWAAYEYHVSKEEAYDRWGIEIKEDDARVIDFFNRTINAIVFSSGGASNGTKADSQFVKEPTPHNLGHVPIWVGFASGMPTVYTKNNEPTLKHRASSVYASSRGIYEPFNKQVSFLMDKMEASVAGPLGYRTKEGKKLLPGDPFKAFTVFALAEGEEIFPIIPPQAPPETSAILSLLDREKQESTVPYGIGYGMDPQGTHSGTALTMLNDNTRSIYDPFTGMIEQGYRWLCEEILVQFKAKGQKMTLKGFNQEGKFFTFNADPNKIRDDWYIVVKCEPKLPRDEAAELQMGLAARTPDSTGRPLLDDYTILEKILKLQNPDAIDTRIETQQVSRMIEKMPNIQVRRLAQALIEKGDIQGAQEMLAQIPSPTSQGGGQAPGGPQGQPMPQGSAVGPQGAQQGQPPPQLTPQQMQQAAQMAEQLARAGKPIPQELQAVLAQMPQGAK